MRRFITIAFLLLINLLTKGQTIIIPDPIILDLYETHFPLSVSGNTLDTSFDFSGLKELDLSNHEISNPEGIQYLTGLERINLSSNELEYVPDFSRMLQLQYVNIQNNFLKFSDLFPLLQYTMNNLSLSPDSLILFPQEGKQTETEHLAGLQAPFVKINGNESDTLTGTSYVWVYDNESLDTTEENKLLVENEGFESGTYLELFQINSAYFAGEMVLLERFHLKLNGCDAYSDEPGIDPFVIENCYNKGELYLSEIDTMRYDNHPIILRLVNEPATAVFPANGLLVAGLEEGVYDLVIEDALGCLHTSSDYVEVIRTQRDCDPVLSPNGDGNSDYYPITTPGKVSILAKNGELVFEGEAPLDWLCIDNDGNLVRPGVYAILLNDKLVITVVVRW